MRNRKPSAARRRSGEEGSAIIVALIMMAVLMTVSLAATSVRVASARGADSRERQQDEYWGARSGASAVEASLRTDIPARYDADVASAKQMAGSRRLPSFDAQSVTASQSRPVMNTDGQRSSNDIASCTSLLGNINTWASARLGIAEAYAQQLGHNARVAVLREAFRPQLAGGNAFAEPGYALEFYIDAAAGENGRVRPSGLVMLGPAVQGCNTTVTLNTSPSTITQGQTALLVVTYENAIRIVVSESGGAVVANQVVTESGATQTISFNVTPATTTTYVATATNATGCRADSAPRTLTVTIPPPRIVLFEANPSCIILGDSSTLRWTIEGATSATINGSAVNPVSGSGPVSPTADTTYTLVASNSSGSTQAQATVSVTIPPRINIFAADDSCVIAGDSTTLRWNAADAATVKINGAPVNPASGSLTVTPAANTTYTIVATGSGCAPQTVQAQVTINVTTPPRINSFTGAPTTIIRGSGVSALLAWDITGATGATINGAAVNPASGTMSVMPNVTTTYTLTATGGGCSPQQRQATVTIVVEDDPGPGSCPAINRLTAAPSCLVAGQSSQISWDVTDADTVTLNGSPVALSGSLNVTPSATTVYTLVASRPGCAPEQRQVTVEVATPPTINSFRAAPDIIQQGQTTSLQWNVSDAASVTIDGVPVNPASGSLPVSPNATRSYTIIATGGGCSPQQRQATVTITVNPCPQINLFSASPPSVTAGGTSTLQWSVSNASAVTINGSPVGASGSMPVTPGSTTSYRLVAQSASGGCDIEQTVTVTVTACSAPQIVSFSANPASVTQGAGGLVRLSWQVNDTSGTGVSVSISPGVGGGLPQTGFVDISAPAATTTYTLTATAGCGASASTQTQVTVTPPKVTPCPDPPPGSPEANTGGGSGGAFSISGGAGRVDTQVRIFYHAEYYPDATVRYNLRLEVSSDPDGSQSHFLVSGGAGGREGLIGPELGWTFYSGFCHGKSGFCGLRFLDAAGNVILDAPFQSIQQPPGANMRIYTLVGDDGSFFTTPGVSLPYPSMDFTNDRIRINPFAVNAGNIAAFSTNKGTFNTSVSGTQSSWRCP